jgi:hypothetical protein
MEPSRNGVIEKMEDLVECIIEKIPRVEYLMYGSENGTKHAT